MNRPQLIVSTDLDGTLLDHHDYSFVAALPALRRCQALGFPVILNTSKTLAEVIALQQALEISAPLIVENGSAISFKALDMDISAIQASGLEVVQEGQRVTVIFGVQRARILAFVEALRRRTEWKFSGFNDWSIAQIAEQTGLTRAEAEQAAQKQYSEPLVWLDDERTYTLFEAAVIEAGFRLLKGGRFIHIQGATDKAQPLLWLKQQSSILFSDSNGNTTPKLLCLGDNHNDVAMLNVADFPVCVRSPVADYPQLTTDKPILKTTGFGPVGWDEAVSTILDAL